MRVCLFQVFGSSFVCIAADFGLVVCFESRGGFALEGNFGEIVGEGVGEGLGECIWIVDGGVVNCSCPCGRIR